MTYSKPEVEIQGDASALINDLHHKTYASFEGGMPPTTPAYDLDE